jgi:catechol 2,3-dioxygenase-like lactoylglutathione lyase family enzyme
MIDHIGMPVSDVARSTEFYLKALAPLGISIVMEVSAEESGRGAAVGFGANSKPFFWIGEAEGLGAAHVHVAFAAPSRAVVDAFYRAAIAAGGKDNGRPGLRPHYHPDYYGAFVLDFDGHNIEAVCHKPALK